MMATHFPGSIAQRGSNIIFSGSRILCDNAILVFARFNEGEHLTYGEAGLVEVWFPASKLWVANDTRHKRVRRILIFNFVPRHHFTSSLGVCIHCGLLF